MKRIQGKSMTIKRESDKKRKGEVQCFTYASSKFPGSYFILAHVVDNFIQIIYSLCTNILPFFNIALLRSAKNRFMK